MVRSLHMKLVLILILLMLSLMLLVGTFLINGTTNYFISEFSDKMAEAFSENTGMVADLRAAAGSDAPVERMGQVLQANSGNLGLDPGSREYYILDADTGAYLTGSDESGLVEITPNILTAMGGEVGYAWTQSGSFIDAAVPISGPSGDYIVYIRDSRRTLRSLTMEMVTIILEALAFGLMIAVLLSLLLSKTLTTPIEDITRGAKRIAAGDFSQKLRVESRDELGVLTQTFNNMAGVLEQSMGEIRAERNKLSTLFLHMTDGVLAYTREGRLLHVNPAAQEILGDAFDRQADLRTTLGQFADVDVLMGLEPPDFREALCPLGDRQLKFYFVPFGTGTDEGGLMTVLRDVTEQEHTEEVRREFVANVSHELRTPLTNIKSYAETLVDDPDLPPEMSQQFLRVILGEVDRMTLIVRDLLTLSRLDYGKMDWHMAFLAPERVLSDVCTAVRLEARRREQTLTLETAPELPRIVGDRSRLEQVFMNILSNAMKYTPDGGSIKVTGDMEGDFLRVTVADTGVGIPPEDLDRLFERFYRVEKARSRGSGGTGLGLAIAKEIVDYHHGDIRIESTVGQGTTVTILLPREQPVALEEPQ